MEALRRALQQVSDTFPLFYSSVSSAAYSFDSAQLSLANTCTLAGGLERLPGGTGGIDYFLGCSLS